MSAKVISCVGAVAVALISGAPQGAAADDIPALVSAYAGQLARQCGPLTPGTRGDGLVERVDLNGDKIDDWVVDAGRYPCPGRPAMAVAAGAQLTIFKGMANGVAVPALQRPAFGSRLQRPADGPPVLWVTLGGSDCGSTNPADRCERKVVWNVKESRFETVDPGVKPKPR